MLIFKTTLQHYKRGPRIHSLWGAVIGVILLPSSSSPPLDPRLITQYMDNVRSEKQH